MSSFRVYGMTESKARQLARATPPGYNEPIEKYEERVKERFEKLMAGGREVPLSNAFDAPQFAQQFIEMARRAGRCRNLHIRRPETIHVKRGKKVVPTTYWKEYVT